MMNCLFIITQVSPESNSLSNITYEEGRASSILSCTTEMIFQAISGLDPWVLLEASHLDLLRGPLPGSAHLTYIKCRKETNTFAPSAPRSIAATENWGLKVTAVCMEYGPLRDPSPMYSSSSSSSVDSWPVA